MVTINLLTLIIFVVRFLGATLLCTLWGLSELALHILSKKTFKKRVSVREDRAGMAAMYSSASFNPDNIPSNSWMGMLKDPIFCTAMMILEVR